MILEKTLTLKPPPSELLRAIAEEALDAHGTPKRALAAFVVELRDAGGLINDLIDDTILEVRALAFLEKIAKGAF